MKSVCIEIKNISKYYEDTAALERVTLNIKEGEIFFLLGPSGCGKTTLLRILAGLTMPSSGRVFIDGSDITDQPPHLRQTAMVFQNYALWPHMTVDQNVQFAMTVKKVEKSKRTKKAAEALKIVHMQEFARKKPAQLSGGEQQRVALARAIAADPRCLLLDEPLSNLDANLRVEMRTEIRRICKQTGITTIYVTHDQKEALSIADRIAVLNKGKVEQVAEPNELYSKPSTKFVAGFVGETNFLQGNVEGIHDDKIIVKAGSLSLQGSAFSGQLGEDDRAVCSVRPEKISISSQESGGVNEIRATIERVTFMGELTQYEVRLQDMGPLKVIETTSEPGRNKGEHVILRINPKDVYVYKDE